MVLLSSGAALPARSALGLPAHPQEPSLLRRAFWTCYPPCKFARTACASAGVTSDRPQHRFTEFVHRREITTPTNRPITAVNNDVHVSWARIDQYKGPLRRSVPGSEGLYCSLILPDAFTEDFFIIPA